MGPGMVDEDCDGKTNCEDSDCRTEEPAYCEGQCDKDGDEHYSLACDGDDCVDDTAITPHAPFIHGGLDYSGNPMTEGSCTDLFDGDCDGARNCADSDCSTDPSCQGGGGGGDPQPGIRYCSWGNEGTDWYVYDREAMQWYYAFTTWEYSTHCYMHQ